MFTAHAHKAKFGRSFVAHSLAFLLHESLAGFLFNKGGNLICEEKQVNSKIGSGLFPQMLHVFLSVTVRIGQNLLNEVPVESSILADFANYHFKSFK